MNEMIRWSSRGDEGTVEHGRMPVTMVSESLKEYADMAKKILQEKDADHVLYGMEIFKDNSLVAAQFFMWPMTDEKFKKITRNVLHSMIYAVHRRQVM